MEIKWIRHLEDAKRAARETKKAIFVDYWSPT